MERAGAILKERRDAVAFQAAADAYNAIIIRFFFAAASFSLFRFRQLSLHAASFFMPISCHDYCFSLSGQVFSLLFFSASRCRLPHGCRCHFHVDGLPLVALPLLMAAADDYFAIAYALLRCYCHCCSIFAIAFCRFFFFATLRRAAFIDAATFTLPLFNILLLLRCFTPLLPFAWERAASSLPSMPDATLPLITPPIDDAERHVATLRERVYMRLSICYGVSSHAEACLPMAIILLSLRRAAAPPCLAILLRQHATLHYTCRHAVIIDADIIAGRITPLPPPLFYRCRDAATMPFFDDYAVIFIFHITIFRRLFTLRHFAAAYAMLLLLMLFVYAVCADDCAISIIYATLFDTALIDAEVFRQCFAAGRHFAAQLTLLICRDTPCRPYFTFAFIVIIATAARHLRHCRYAMILLRAMMPCRAMARRIFRLHGLLMQEES